jgi:hypothetical protein
MTRAIIEFLVCTSIIRRRSRRNTAIWSVVSTLWNILTP